MAASVSAAVPLGERAASSPGRAGFVRSVSASPSRSPLMRWRAVMSARSVEVATSVAVEVMVF
jgi:hypothetical protein